MSTRARTKRKRKRMLRIFLIALPAKLIALPAKLIALPAKLTALATKLTAQPAEPTALFPTTPMILRANILECRPRCLSLKSRKTAFADFSILQVGKGETPNTKQS